jgi:carbon starvation protein
MGRVRYLWVTVGPLLWLLAVTLTAGLMKIFSPAPLGFLATARALEAKLAAGGKTAELITWQAQLFNNRVDAVVTGIFLILVSTVVVANARVWWKLLVHQTPAVLREEPYVSISGAPTQ